ncbi:hypothetical protein pb186bvf_009182 [Paramecium bursaria]
MKKYLFRGKSNTQTRQNNSKIFFFIYFLLSPQQKYSQKLLLQPKYSDPILKLFQFFNIIVEFHFYFAFSL